MNKDTLTGIVGAVLLIGAMAGVFFYERAQAADLLADEPTFEVADAAGPTASGSVDLNGQATEELTINTANLTKVAFTLTWSSTNSDNTVRLTVQPPEGVGEGNTSESASGSLSLAVDVPNPEPTDGAQTVGTGTWRVTVAFVEASGDLPVQQDQTVDWDLATTLSAWAPADA